MLDNAVYHANLTRQSIVCHTAAVSFIRQDHVVHLPMRLSRAPTAHARDLTTTQRHLGVTVLLGNTGLMNFGFSVLIPLLAVHFTGRLGFTAASIGLVLALRQFSQQGLDLVGGLIGDHFGARTSIAVGCFVRAAGFAGIGLAHTLGMLITFAVISGIGGAFFDAPSTAALADLVSTDRRQRVYAASATFGNAGVTLGPVVGVALLGIGFQAVSLAAAACFVLVGMLTLAFVPATALAGGHIGDSAPTGSSTRHGLVAAARAFVTTTRAIAADRTFVLLTVFLAGFWFLWAQMNITVPLAADRLGGPHFVALAFAINAGPAILCQYPLARFVGERCAPRHVLAIALAVCAVGMALAFAGSAAGVFFLGIGLFALARMLIGPVVNTVTADLAPVGMLGAYFGFGALAVAMGAGFGQYAGGVLYDIAQARHAPLLLSLPLLAFGVGAAYGLLRLPLAFRPGGHSAPAPRTDALGVAGSLAAGHGAPASSGTHRFP